MWINTHNLTDSPSVPEGRDSTSDLNWFFELLEQSAGSSGKPSPAIIWRRQWKKDSWLRRLSGRTSKPSTAAHGVASWITSLRATRASRSASPGSVLARTILDTFGPTFIESLERLHRHSYFSKTCPRTSPSDSTRSPASLKTWATRSRQDSSLRVKRVLRSVANGSSSSLWSTPNVPNRGPESRDSKKRRKSGGVDLQTQARVWPTPNTGQSLSGHGARGGRAKNGRQSGNDLPAFVKLWPTPAARDSKGANSHDHVTTNGTGRKHLDQLANFASHCFPRDLVNSNSGAKSSSATDQLAQLNPRFVCWLMGWPWINPATCGSTGTELSPSQQRMRSSPFGPLSDPVQWRNAWTQVLYSMVAVSAFIAPAVERTTSKNKAAA
jgi:hypothetical protein